MPPPCISVNKHFATVRIINVEFALKMSNLVLFSSSRCRQVFSVPVNCSVILSEDNSTIISLGPYGPGEFPGDPDIAGIGACTMNSGVQARQQAYRRPLGHGCILRCFNHNGNPLCYSCGAQALVRLENTRTALVRHGQCTTMQLRLI
jgi:hypothetical protein